MQLGWLFGLHRTLSLTFDERVREHVVCGTVDESDVTVCDCVSNKVVANIDVLGMCLKLTKFGMSKGDCQLVIVMDNNGIIERFEKFGDELMHS